MTLYDDCEREEQAARDKKKADAEAEAAKQKSEAEAEARRIAREEAKKLIDEEIEPAPEAGKGKG